jgi:hypothetical protein
MEIIRRVKDRKQRWGAAGLEFQWNGAHTVNVFDEQGTNFDVFSIGDFAKDAATTDDVLRGIKNYLEYREEGQ